MRIIPLASSSKANAYLVDGRDTALLIDNGLTYKEFKKRAGAFPQEKISAILVTHSHTDHIGGLSPFLAHHEVPVYANVMTAEAIVAATKLSDDRFVCFENGQPFLLGEFTVHPFSIPHDTADPVGFLIKTEGFTYFHGTDIGTPLDSIGLKLGEADIATLESNHDPVMLKTSGRAASLIQRIAGPRGHLANDQAAELVRRFASPKLKRLYLAHLSRDCNLPRFALATMRETLKEMHREDIEVEVLSP